MMALRPVGRMGSASRQSAPWRGASPSTSRPVGDGSDAVSLNGEHTLFGQIDGLPRSRGCQDEAGLPWARTLG